MIRETTMDFAIKQSEMLLNDMIRAVSRYEKQINEFDKERKKYNRKIKPIPVKVFNEIKSLIKDKSCPIETSRLKVYSTSSYSANMNLPNDSDLDFTLTVKDMNDETLYHLISYFSKHGFTYYESRNTYDPRNIHYVMTKVEKTFGIELKIRDEDKSKSVIALHQKIDNKISLKRKKICVFIKYLIMNYGSKELYKAFKTIFYTSSFKGIKNNFPIIS